jgi:tRNA (adenine58-N1)-methyltransferase non-catalytic subunit
VASSSSAGDTSASVVAGDNRGYVDSNTAQKLRPEDIKRLREAGASGKDIIQSLIANSDTWAAKTEFAQAKWLKKKTQKYFRRLRVVKCCPATVCEVYHEKNKDKICGLRWDSLAQLLSNGGVHSGMRVLIFDGVLGMVVGSVAYRLKGQGKILAAFAGQQPHFTIGDFLNLDDESLGIIQVSCTKERDQLTGVAQDTS